MSELEACARLAGAGRPLDQYLGLARFEEFDGAAAELIDAEQPLFAFRWLGDYHAAIVRAWSVWAGSQRAATPNRCSAPLELFEPRQNRNGWPQLRQRMTTKKR